MNRFISLLIITLFLAPTAANAQVYKWKDKNGVTQYSDTPPPTANAQEVKAKSAAPKPTAKEAEMSSKKPVNSSEKLEKDAAKRQLDAENDKKTEEIKDAERKVKEANCATAKSNYNTYKQGGRIVSVDDKGNRKYYDDAEIAKGLEDAKAKMEEHCE